MVCLRAYGVKPNKQYCPKKYGILFKRGHNVVRFCVLGLHRGLLCMACRAHLRAFSSVDSCPLYLLLVGNVIDSN